MSRDTNPLSLEQMRNALTYLDTQNNLRKANGQSALSVSLRMTVAAALNTSYSSNIWDTRTATSTTAKILPAEAAHIPAARPRIP